jgi:hypothetical protein
MYYFVCSVYLALRNSTVIAFNPKCILWIPSWIKFEVAVSYFGLEKLWNALPERGWCRNGISAANAATARLGMAGKEEKWSINLSSRVGRTGLPSLSLCLSVCLWRPASNGQTKESGRARRQPESPTSQRQRHLRSWASRSGVPCIKNFFSKR